MSLEAVRLKTAIAYPVIEPRLDWAIASLLIWDKVTLIWDPHDIAHLSDYAVRTPILLDHGFVELAKPETDDVSRASTTIEKISTSLPAAFPTDEEFESSFALHPVKVTAAYWDHARRSSDGFVHVPPRLGALYVALLSDSMAARARVPTLAMRYQEPLYVAGASGSPIKGPSAGDCVVRSALEVLEIQGKSDSDTSEPAIVKAACADIAALRRLEAWHSWRKVMCEYLDALAGAGTDGDKVAMISAELRAAIRKYQKEASRQKWVTIAKIGVTGIGGVVGFFVGSVPGAIAGATAGGAMLGIDLYQSSHQGHERRSGWQHFVLEARKRFSLRFFSHG